VRVTAELRASVEGLRRDLVPRRVLLRRWWLTGLAALLLLALVAGTAWNTRAIRRQQHEGARAAYEACVDRNTRAEASGRALARLVEASRADGDAHAERVWREFVAVSGRTPLPECVKPK
jgi:hypothetical protein